MHAIVATISTSEKTEIGQTTDREEMETTGLVDLVLMSEVDKKTKNPRVMTRGRELTILQTSLMIDRKELVVDINH